MSENCSAKAAITCENCNLENLCIPKGLSKTDVHALENLVKRNVLLQKGAYLYQAGMPFKGILALRSGSAKLLQTDRAGSEMIVDFTLPGELLGFDGLAEHVHSCSAVALETVSFCLLPAAKITTLAQQLPSLSLILLQRSGSQYQQQIQQSLLCRATAEAKVAGFILGISERLKMRGYAEFEFRLSMSREDIGQHLDIAHETVSRILHQFQAQALITIKTKQLKIVDKKKLLSLM